MVVLTTRFRRATLGAPSPLDVDASLAIMVALNSTDQSVSPLSLFRHGALGQGSRTLRSRLRPGVPQQLRAPELAPGHLFGQLEFVEMGANTCRR